MLSRIYRLPARQKFKEPSFFKSSMFTVKIAFNNLEISRFGFIVRKSIDKRAVARNRLKRVIRSCIEEMHVGIGAGRDMLFVLEKGIIGKDRGEIFQEVKRILTERKLLKL